MPCGKQAHIAIRTRTLYGFVALNFLYLAAIFRNASKFEDAESIVKLTTMTMRGNTRSRGSMGRSVARKPTQPMANASFCFAMLDHLLHDAVDFQRGEEALG